jgi:probable phosphomutase (TIGR03848 family)
MKPDVEKPEEHAPKKKPTRILLIRHAMNEWVKSGRLAGRTPGIHLSEEGKEQAQALGRRLASRPIHAIYASPLERAQETAMAVARHHQLPVESSEGITEVDFGDWTGRELKELAKEPEWPLIQGRPSAMRFPNGESPREMLTRSVDEIERLAGAHPEQTVILVSHSDVIKGILAHYLGMHLDQFQRLVVSPSSISSLAFTPMGAMVTCVNDTAHLPPPEEDD